MAWNRIPAARGGTFSPPDTVAVGVSRGNKPFLRIVIGSEVAATMGLRPAAIGERVAVHYGTGDHDGMLLIVPAPDGHKLKGKEGGPYELRLTRLPPRVIQEPYPAEICHHDVSDDVERGIEVDLPDSMLLPERAEE